MINRRDAIKTIGGLAGMASLSKLLSGCGADNGGPAGITTYVFVMLENRSYDHYLGARKLIESLPGDGLLASMRNNDVNGVPIAPFEPAKDKMCDPDPPHGWDELRVSWNNGACDGFVKAHQMAHSSTTLTDPMQYMTRTQLPISWALADAYTSCDRWFCSLMGPTLPNRAYWHTGTSLGIGKEPDANTRVLNAFSNGIPVPSIYNRLHDKKIDWAYYYGTLPVVSLLANPGPYALDLGPSDGTGNVRRFGDPEAKLGQFFKDAEAGKLPAVVYIDPSFYINDDHPPIHPINGQALVASIYSALAASPQWKNCMLVVTYDENGGFFDHVSPPMTADDTMDKFGMDGFTQLGFRVPTIVAGPYIKKSYVSSVQYDHTSVLKHIQNTFGTAPINPRIDAANDLLDCIDMDRLMRGEWAQPITLPTINVADWPMDPNMCMHSGGFKLQDPISVWADAHPGAFGNLDLRGDIPSTDACIRNYLRAKGVLVSD